MKILVDARHSVAGGGRSFISSVLSAWCALPEASTDEIGVMTADEVLIGSLRSKQVRWIRTKREHVLMRQTRGQFDVRRELKKGYWDGLYCPGNFGLVFTPEGTPVVVTLQNAHLALPTEKDAPLSIRARLWCERQYFRYSAERATTMTTISESLHKDALHMIGNRTPVVMIRSGGAPSAYNGAGGKDESGADMQLDRPTRSPDKPYILVVGNFYLHKHHECVLEMCALAFESWADPPPLVIVANNAQPSALRRFDRVADRLSYPVVRIEGASAGQIRWLYRNCLVYVSASVREAYPLTPEEAAAEGATVLLSDIPSHREVLPTATFYPCGDTSAGASALRALADGGGHSHVPADRSRRTGAGRWAGHARDLRHLFSTLIDPMASQR